MTPGLEQGKYKVSLELSSCAGKQENVRVYFVNGHVKKTDSSLKRAFTGTI